MRNTGLEEINIVPAAEMDLTAIADLAATIWHRVYPGIISVQQIDYMLGKMYSFITLRDEIRSQGVRYDRLLVDGGLAGFSSYGPTASREVMKLHKLYLLPERHGRGLGWRLLQHCEREVRKTGASRLVLNVNKHNSRAVALYERNGFRITQSVVVDIGGGFVMDDYVMTKELTL